MKKIKVLIVDDSAVVRRMLEKYLSREKDIEVVGKASDPYSARDKIVFNKPDVVTLDIDMPRMDGLKFLEKLMPQYPIPVIMFSSMTDSCSKMTLKALELGAFDYVLKPAGGQEIESTVVKLVEKIKAASRSNIAVLRKNAYNDDRTNKIQNPFSVVNDRIIAIGASTGGTIAINRVISQFPADMPPVVITQHMPPVFTRHFAESLNSISKMEVKEAEDGDLLKKGRVLVAPGGYHMEIIKKGSGFAVKCYHNYPVNGHQPSVDVMFHSLARTAGDKVIALLLTGMGKDGAEGLLHIRSSGGKTIAQDEESSVVFGMPKAGYENGGAEMLVGLDNMYPVLIDMLSGNKYQTITEEVNCDVQ